MDLATVWATKQRLSWPVRLAWGQIILSMHILCLHIPSTDVIPLFVSHLSMGRGMGRAATTFLVCHFTSLQRYDIQSQKNPEEMLVGKEEIFHFIEFPKTTFVLKNSLRARFWEEKVQETHKCYESKYSGRKKKTGSLKYELCYLTEVNRDRPNQQAWHEGQICN